MLGGRPSLRALHITATDNPDDEVRVWATPWGAMRAVGGGRRSEGATIRSPRREQNALSKAPMTPIGTAVISITDAHWDERSLGIPCTELVLDDDIDKSELETVLASLRPGYQVVKVAAGSYVASELLGRNGFVFVEVSIGVRHRQPLQPLSSPDARLLGATSVRKLSAGSDLLRLKSEIFQGIFLTDRVSLDPQFARHVAATRYWNWICDERRDGGEIYELLHDENPVGFFVLRRTDPTTCKSILSGLYRSSKIPGLGSALLRQAIMASLALGCTKLVSAISRNNPAVLRTHVKEGFEFTTVQSVFSRFVEDDAHFQVPNST